ncbi:MAG: sigma-E processing peptidase SpoIIGA [Oscillospiraceae bacterium]|jgi:stage II sporulation protein GA (sporulation sigma-E factor processing peptidase)|nr:sigma-E processing peptidase SpoIIGA [Oscillospiraceae bacterium]
MVVYVDIAFLLNCLADGAALYVTGRLSGLPLRKRRLLAAALLGGTYGALCALPGWSVLASFLPQTAAAAGLVWLAFGKRGAFLRQLLLFFILSCAMGGALVAGGRLLESGEGLAVLTRLDWRVFFLAGGVCFLVLSVVFRGGARHAVAGQLCQCVLERGGRRAALTALLDTGHTLTDGLTGRPVLTAHWEALEPLWTAEERDALSHLERDGSAACLERLGGGFRLLPYQAVGVSGGLLLCFQAERAAIDGKVIGPVTVALSPSAVSDGGGYGALWGGECGKEGCGHAA